MVTSLVVQVAADEEAVPVDPFAALPFAAAVSFTAPLVLAVPVDCEDPADSAAVAELFAGPHGLRAGVLPAAGGECHGEHGGGGDAEDRGAAVGRTHGDSPEYDSDAKARVPAANRP